MPITPLSAPPSRTDPVNFAARSDALFTALPQLVTEINALQLSNNTQAASLLAQSQVARDLSVQAWAASMSPAETLPAISKSIHSGAIVKTFLYDTSKDSDGGAWRKRCADKSWYTESINGAWLGQAATAAAAWAISGAATGAYFQNTTDGKFYALGASSPTVLEVFRGNVREFPEQVAIVVESVRVIIYDLTQPNCPMWSAYVANTVAGTPGTEWWRSGRVIGSVSAMNGVVYFGAINNEDDVTGLMFVSLVGGRVGRYARSVSVGGVVPYATRNISIVDASLPAIIASGVNDCAITVLGGAPTDSATGLPVPTIAVATAGGISVIKHDGVVVNSASTAAAYGVSFDKRNRVQWNYFDHVATSPTPPLSSGFATSSSKSILLGGSGAVYAATCIPVPFVGAYGSYKTGGGYIASSGGLVALKIDGSSDQSMVACITKVYNSGWLFGDSRGAWLADTVGETLIAPGELVANGTFSAGTDGWAAARSAVLSVSGGAMVITSGGVDYPQAQQGISTISGRYYWIEATQSSGVALSIVVGTSIGGNQLGTTVGSGSVGFSFLATTAQSYITLQANATGVASVTVDNISVKLSDRDRSTKRRDLIVNGTLTKSVVAPGAQLVSYSGFSTSNYLEQAYNSDLDFGTGNFSVMGWTTVVDASTNIVFTRGTSGAGAISIYTDSVWKIGCSATEVEINTSVAATVGNHFFSLQRLFGVLQLYIDDVLVYSVANTENITNVAATAKVGINRAKTLASNGSIALIRVSATAPSADQIAHIYRTELQLFQPNVKCTIDGTSSSVTALAYDESANALQVGTSWGRSAFRDLVRVESEASMVGSVTSISANQGAIITGGTSARYYQPAMQLRDELRRKDEARRALGQVPVFVDFDAGTSQVAFVLPKGYSTKAVYTAGALKRVGATKDYTTSFDGFQETVIFGTAPGNTVWVSVMCVRSA